MFVAGLCIGAADAAEPAGKRDAGMIFVRVGIAGVLFDSSAKLAIAGQAVPGASGRASDNATVIAEVGAYVFDNVSLMLSVGVPPTSKFVGTGTARAFGSLGKATYGPLVLAAQYHPQISSWFRPYVGAGVANYIVFGTEDAAVRNLAVKNTYGPVIHVGADVFLTEMWGLYVDVKKIWIQTRASGLVALPGGDAPVLAKAKLNPLVLSIGLTVRF